MKTRLLWKLFGLNLLVIGIVVLVVWGAVDYLAKGYFVTLMEEYHISPTDSHRMFIDSIHRYLIWGSLLAILIAALICFMLMRRILGPLTQMTQMTKKIGAGDFPDAIPVSSGDEVGQLAEAFNRMTENLKHIEALRKTMIVDVAHELKTPLTNIQGYLEAVTDGVVPPTPETIGLLQEETQRLAHLVSDILQLARSGGAKLSLDILKIRLLDAANHLLAVFRLKLDQKKIRVDSTGIDPACRVHADPLKLAQVFHNLIQNALQYTPPGGRLRLFAESGPAEVKITFANTGGELKEEDLPLMFERFYRGEKSRSREFGGAGIGLAVVKDLVEAHGGKVGAHLAGDVIEIWFTLPVRPV